MSESSFLMSESLDPVVFTLIAGAAAIYMLNKLLSTNPKVTQLSKPYGCFDENGVLWNSRSVGKCQAVPENGATTSYELMTKAIESGGSNPAVGKRTLIQRYYEDFNGKKVEKLQFADHYEWLSFAEYGRKMANFGSGLVKAGLAPKDRIIIYAETQLEWMLAAQAAFRQGLTVVTIYATLGEEGLLYGAMQTKAKCIVADAKLLKVLAKVFKEDGDKIKRTCSKVVYIPDAPTVADPIMASTIDTAVASLTSAGVTVSTFQQVLDTGAAAPADPTPPVAEDCAVIMYTSGTTGNPKGVMLSHRNIVACVAGMAFKLPEFGFKMHDEAYLAYLPLAHIMEMAGELCAMGMGMRVGYGSPHTLTPTGVKIKTGSCLGDAACCKPTLMVFAPAVIDKVYAGLNTKMKAASPIIQTLFNWGLAAGEKNFDKNIIGAPWFYNKIIFKKVQALLGGRLKAVMTGSAPLSPAIQKFAQTAFNCPVRQGYGLTETTAASTLGEACQNTPGLIGPPTNSTCIMLEDWPEGNYLLSDASNPTIGMPRGEILIGGPMVCMGYLVDPENPDADVIKRNQTDFTTDANGIRWFHTGDIGQITPDGIVQVIDRKKDLVKLQQGEYVALSKVENVMKLCPLVELALCYAKSTESFCVAIVCPHPAPLKELAASLGVEGDHSALCKNAKVTDAVTKAVQAACKGKLVAFETPKKVGLCDETWTPENDMLTAAMKLKRIPIVAKHKALIDSIYQ